MGREKEAMMEADDRGWNKPAGYVCSNCVEDEFLKDVIRENACHRECDYCDHRTRSHSAAPVEVLMEPISSAVYCWYNDPINAMMPYDSEDDGWLFDSTDTRDMLKSLPLECDDQLFEDIAEAFIQGEWVETAEGCWTGSHPYELMDYSWDRFAYIVKHEARYFFQQSLSSLADQEQYYLAQQEQYNPAYFLPTLGELVKALDLLRSLPTDISPLFRARPRNEGENFALDAKQLGAPPPEKVSAGRMNPAGISYLYLAFEQETALAEVQSDPLQQTAIGQFEIQRKLHVLDLTNLPEKPSIFDDYHRDELGRLLFLDKFVEKISKPVKKDGSEHIDYVPSQVVSEYFALVFRADDDKHLDGIMYPSAVRQGGINLVLFPTERSSDRLFDQVAFQNGAMLNA